MSLSKIVPMTIGIAAAALILAGCASGAAKTDGSAPSASSSASKASPSKAATGGGGSSPTSASAPGTKVGLNEWVSYNFTTTDKTTALISAELTSVEPATQAQTDFLVGKISQLKGYKVWLIHVTEKKVSGATVAFNADYTNFYPATADGKKAQAVSVIGWDDCSTNSFPTEFDTVGTPLDQCFVGASVQGGDPVVGVVYASYDDKALDYYDGKPLQLLK